MSAASVSACLLFLLSVCSSCYISNCPIGGKRSITDAPLRRCMSCGPAERGRCFGPGICCGEALGCLLGSPETSRCAEENYLLTPCQTGGKPCGSDGGHCAAAGFCCDAESCAADPNCLADEDADDPSSQLDGGDPGDVILRLLRLVGHTSHRVHQ